MIQLKIHDIEHAAHARQLLVLLLRFIIHRRHRYIITHRRICRQPPTVLRIQVSRSVVIQPHARNAGYRACFILLLCRKYRNLAVASRVLLCKTRKKACAWQICFFYSSNAMILSRAELSKSKTAKYFMGISCRRFVANRFIIMHIRTLALPHTPICGTNIRRLQAGLKTLDVVY